MLFKYTVLDREKKLLSGEMEADTVKNARLSLLQQGYDVLLLESLHQRYLKIHLKSVGFVSLKEKMLFVKHLSLMIKSGMVLDESIEALYEQAKGRMRDILLRLVELVRKGNLLSDGLKLFPYTFNEFFVNMVRVGEKSGSMEQNLINLAVKLKKDHDLKTKVTSALMYPAIVVLALGGLGITMTLVVLPKLLGLFESLSIQLPLPTQVFIVIAKLIQSYWYGFLLGLIGAGILLVIFNKLERTKGAIHWVILHLPLSRRFSRTANLANFCRSMHLMLNGGVTIDEALDIMSRALTNALYQRRIVYVLQQVRKGAALSSILAQFPNYFPQIVSKMIHVGELSGNLSETFDYLAEFYEDELDAYSRNLSTLLEPILLIVIGLIVGFMALSIISPIYELTGGISPTR